MKRVVIYLILFVFIGAGEAYSQDSSSIYRKIDYVRVDTDQITPFLNTTTNKLKEAYQQLVDDGELNGWQLYYVKYPGGDKTPYNFISIVSASDLAQFEDVFTSIGNRAFSPLFQASSDMSEASENKADLVKSELWRIEERMYGSDDALSSEYFQIDYMNVMNGRGSDYLMLEHELARPIHKRRMEKGIMAGWEVYSLISPGGLSYGYNYATGNHYNSLSNLEYSFDDEIINQNVGTDTNIPELFNTVYSTRDHIRTILSKMVVHTN